MSTLLPLVIVLFIIAVGVVLLTQQFRKNIYLQKLKQEELKNLQQLDLLRSSIEVQEEERKRIALDLHDELGAILSITRMHILQLEKQFSNDSGPTEEALKNIRTLTETSLSNMRRISHELMPPQLESFGLEKTLTVLAEQLNKTSDLNLTLDFNLGVYELKWQEKLALYRVFLEMINNTIKHAQAKEILIELRVEGRYILATYKDNGIGIHTANFLNGLGTKSMHGRIKALGGQIQIDNIGSPHFKAMITIPII